MYSIEIPKEINYIISLFYRMGLWHRGDKATVGETRMKIFYCFYNLLLLISLMVGAATTGSKEESILLTEAVMVVTVLTIKLFYIIWKKDEIIEILTCICVYSIEDRVQFTIVNDQFKRFMKLCFVWIIFTLIGSHAAAILPIFGNKKKLFVECW